jgi:nucleoid DNA-binding protein
MEELAMRVQAALSLATKKEAEVLVNTFVSCLEDTLIEHLADDGYYFKLNGFGKFTVLHRPSRSRKIGFSGETREIPPAAERRDARAPDGRAARMGRLLYHPRWDCRTR